MNRAYPDIANNSPLPSNPKSAEWFERLGGTELEILWDLEALQRDPATAELIRTGRTMGCFYIESPSMRALFQRMHCERYEEVVAASSIIRPGVAESGMMKEYIVRHRAVRGMGEEQGERKKGKGETKEGCQVSGVRPGVESVKSNVFRSRNTGAAGELRSRGREAARNTAKGHGETLRRSLGQQSKIQNPKSKIDYLHPKLEAVLAETYGVMVYQEDVIKVVHALGGLTMGEADVLRRAMSGKLGAKKAMQSLTDRFMDGCRERGVSEDVVNELWRQIETFARFSFCKGHSAAFAVLSYQVAWLKAHYPAEFMASVLSNGGGYYGAGAYIQECRRMGLRVLGPDVNESEVDYTGETEVRGERREVGKNQKGKGGGQMSGVRCQRQREEQYKIENAKYEIQNEKQKPGQDKAGLVDTTALNSSFIIHHSSFASPSFLSFVRVGLGAIKNFPLDLARRIIRVRRERPFEGLEDFLRRVRPGREAAEKLVRVGGFDRFGVPRERLLLELDMYFRAQSENEGERLDLDGNEVSGVRCPVSGKDGEAKKPSTRTEHGKRKCVISDECRVMSEKTKSRKPITIHEYDWRARPHGAAMSDEHGAMSEKREADYDYEHEDPDTCPPHFTSSFIVHRSSFSSPTPDTRHPTHGGVERESGGETEKPIAITSTRNEHEHEKDVAGERPLSIINEQSAFERPDQQHPPHGGSIHPSAFSLHPSEHRTPSLARYLEYETELLGFGVSAHPLELLPESVWRGTVAALDLRDHVGRRVTMIGWMITAKLIRTHKSREFMKFLSLEDLTDTFEVTLFPRAYRKFAPLAVGPGPYRIRGTVQDDLGAVGLIADQVELVEWQFNTDNRQRMI